MKLKHAENKWNIERQILEEEVMKLKKFAEAGNKSGRNYQFKSLNSISNKQAEEDYGV